MKAGNPLLEHTALPRFEQITPDHVEPAITELLSSLDRRFTELEESFEPTWESAVRAVTEAVEPLEFAWGVVKHLMAVKNSPELREAHDKVQGSVVSAFLRIDQSKARYQALKAIQQSESWSKIPEARQRVISIFIRDAELAGVGLEGAERDRFIAIERELADISSKFTNNMIDSTKKYSLTLTDPADVEGLPENLLQRTAEAARDAAGGNREGGGVSPDKGPWRITLDAPVYGPFMQHAQRRDLREQVYRASIVIASEGESDNQPIIDRMLELRRERAKLLGYRTHAEVSAAAKMAGTVDRIDDLIEQLRSASHPKAIEAWNTLQQFAREELGDPDFELKQWDQLFWAERHKERFFDVSTEMLRPYFPLDKVTDGLFRLAERLFGVQVRPADGEAQVWHPDVRFYKIFDETDAEIAAFYLDPYSRPSEKRSGAWMNHVLDREVLPDGSVQRPVAYLCCNQTPPSEKKPSLMTFLEVTTLFHEFGHGLQHMLTEVDFPEAAGMNNLEWDAVEICSTYLQEWVFEAKTTLEMAQHYESGEPLPKETFERLKSARNHLIGLTVIRQVQLSALDIELYHRYEPGTDETPHERVLKMSDRYAVIPPLPEARFLCQFGHIFPGPYSAGYYSYSWAGVMAADAFAAFEEAGEEEAIRKTGRKFRETFLALGATRHPLDVFREFRGRDPEIGPLLRRYGFIE